MTDLERRALLGDAEAQRECTEKGIVLPCWRCGGEANVYQTSAFGRPLYAVSCKKHYCGAYGCAHRTEKEAILYWNTRHAPPIGRCASCACWDENTCECVAAADIEVAYHRYTEPDFFCGDYEPKGGEENG